MRRRALLASLAIHVGAGLLLFTIGAVTGRLTSRQLRVAPVTLPLRAPEVPAVKEGEGEYSPVPGRRGRAIPAIHFMPLVVT